MAIFNKCHALFLGFLVFAIIGTAGYSVNQGDYFQHQYTFIMIKSLLLFLSFGYARWFDMISFGMLSKKQLLLFIGIFLLTVLVNIGYHAFFSVASGASAQHLEETSKGLSLSFIVSAIVLAPIHEELLFRGLLQGAVFDNSWLGFVLTSSLFSFMHGPSNVPSFIFYLLGGLLLGFAYKKSQNLWVSTLVHMFYNSWPLLYYL
ncbi:CPBP family intramembrane glutamic endopeptidase [Streptococcus mitis]|uniref:CPBP family intramembrane metalloprotease n=1 Tax=Streptococcus mitis TaxID=28037 RepID=A0A6M9F420_STRMT|nr:type II CAAX endopeptidase family protein [Streptococcus mitis]QKL32543.1 CPBP family intramembrane metalloprotease [Streptococcus mitis]